MRALVLVLALSACDVGIAPVLPDAAQRTVTEQCGPFPPRPVITPSYATLSTHEVIVELDVDSWNAEAEWRTNTSVWADCAGRVSP